MQPVVVLGRSLGSSRKLCLRGSYLIYRSLTLRGLGLFPGCRSWQIFGAGYGGDSQNLVDQIAHHTPHAIVLPQRYASETLVTCQSSLFKEFLCRVRTWLSCLLALHTKCFQDNTRSTFLTKERKTISSLSSKSRAAWQFSTTMIL